MPKQIRGAGPNDVGSYQLSGVPYVTSSNGNTINSVPTVVQFPFVTRFFVVSNTSEHPLRIGFSKNGVNVPEGLTSSYGKYSSNRNYFVISGSGGNSPSSLRLELRCKELWFRRDGATEAMNSGFSLIAGLTGIRSDQFPVLTASFRSGSTGNYHNSFEGIG